MLRSALAASLFALHLVACDRTPTAPAPTEDRSHGRTATTAHEQEHEHAVEAEKVPQFIAPVAVDARDQPEGRVVTRLEAGKSYPLLKRGGPGGAWCKLDVGATSAWTECPDKTSVKIGTTKSCASTCAHAPLFPVRPPPTALEREVLALCPSRAEASVTQVEVRRFLAAHVEDARIKSALSAAGRPGGASAKEGNIDWLASFWVSTGPRNAFTHVFCGDDWEQDKLGGLHWLPRYAELEADGKVCFGGAAKGQEPKVGDQYLIRYSALSPWSCGNKSIGGFAVTADPIQIVATGTRAFVRCCTSRGNANDGGVYEASEMGGMRWRIWCGTRNGSYGIATLYPSDEKATCR